MASRKIPDAIQQQVRQRASELCEYCHAEKWQYVLFTVDHVITLSQNGRDTISGKKAWKLLNDGRFKK